MKQVSTLFDALRNEKFAIAVKDNYGIKYYGYDGQGKEWANWANKVEIKSLEDSQIPSGIIQGPYKNISDNELKSLIVAFGYGDSSVDNFVKSKSYRHAGSVRIKTASIVPAVIDTPINYFTGYQYSPAVSYKCLHMRQSIKEGSLMHEAKVNNYAFNFQNWMYNAAPDTQQSKSLRQRFDSHVGRSYERRLGMRLKSAALNYDKTRKQIGIINSLETKSLDEDIEFKAIGQRIGGGARLARRAGRGLTATFDPKAWDGDGDGVVQEGTPFERPAIPGVNDRATGGAVDVAAATRAWEGFASATRVPGGKPIEAPRGARTRVRTSPTRVPNGGSIQAPKGSPQRARTPGGKPRLENVKPITGRPTPSPEQGRGVSRRVSEARAQRQVQGFASRGKAKATAGKKPGIDKVRDTDGQIFNSLDDTQKATVVENLKNRYKQIQDTIKRELGDEGRYNTWWDSFIAKTGRVGSKTDADGNPWSKDSRISGEALRSFRAVVEDNVETIDSEIVAANNALQAEQSAPSPDPQKVKKLTNQVKKLEGEKQALLDDLRDLQVFDAMYENDNWELMEHLSPRSRNSGLGRTVSGSKIKGAKDPFDGKPAPKINWKEPSSFFTEAESYATGKRAIVGKEKSGRLKKFSDRLFENAEAAAERRRLRKARRGTFGIEGENRDRPGSIERARRKLARAKRKIKRRLTGGANEKTVNQEIEKTKSVNPTVFGNGQKGSTPTVTMDGIKAIARLLRGRLPEEEDKDDTKGTNAKSNLGRMWTEQNFNGLPVKIAREDAEYLAGQGWLVIQRGHGGPNPPTNPPRVGQEQFIQDYLDDTKRFVTGIGGTAYGPGEYWSRPGSGWDSWVPEAGGTLALVSPDARVLTATEAGKLRDEHSKVWSKVHAALQGIGGGTISAKDMDPQDLVKELKAALAKDFADGDPMWSTEVGQVLNSLFQFMSTAPASEKADIWNAIQYMTNLGGYGQHFAAMLYGYDGVDHQGGSPVVWFNRAVLAVVDEAMSLPDMKEVADIAKKAA